VSEFQNLKTFQIPPAFRGRSAVVVQLWWMVESFFFKPSPQILYSFRRFLLRLFGAKIGKHVLIRPSVRITYPWKLSIGDFSWIGDDVVLYSLGEIIIGNNTVISQKSYICTGSHDYTKKDFPIYANPILIEDECWLATDVFVAPGITIGKGTVIAARSTVLSDLPGGKVCAGTPAKVLKDRKREDA
jgi:putative colanic acid biosynthesis acetyltransferase WcaF